MVFRFTRQSEGNIIYTKVVGVSLPHRQENLRAQYLRLGERLWWKFDEGNKYDENAVLVFADEAMTVELGHLPRAVAAQVKKAVVEEKKVIAIYVKKMTGMKPPKLRGLNIVVRSE